MFLWGRCFYQRWYLIYILMGLLCHSTYVYNAFQLYSSLATNFSYLPSSTNFFLFLTGHLRHFSSFIFFLMFQWAYLELLLGTKMKGCSLENGFPVTIPLHHYKILFPTSSNFYNLCFIFNCTNCHGGLAPHNPFIL